MIAKGRSTHGKIIWNFREVQGLGGLVSSSELVSVTVLMLLRESRALE